MYQSITNDTRLAVVELLNDNKKALQACNQISRMNFEKPFFAARTVGKFTVNTIKNTIKIPEPWAAVVLFRSEKYPGHMDKKLHVVKLYSDADKFEIKIEGFYPYYYDVDDFFAVGSFNDARKAARGYVYIVAQSDEYRNEKPAPRSVKYVDALKNGERFRNPVTEYGSVYVTRIDGKGERVEAFPRSRYGYNDYTSTGKQYMLQSIVDKSGYSALPALIDRKQRALKLRREREAAKAAAHDFSAQEKALHDRIENLRAEVVEWVSSYDGESRSYSEYRFFDRFVCAAHGLKRHEEKRAAGLYPSIASAENALGAIAADIDAAEKLLHPEKTNDGKEVS